jgi:hypothetical protein
MHHAAFARYSTYDRIIKKTLSIGKTYTVSLFHAEHADAVPGLILWELHIILYIGSIK